mmetsp:Transcript_99710/g.266414  ORF Transcript_99710/g.266414 Transcript_99710/m.266414 type:complete len:213 (+) Transcript_99710:174-812(+)
MRVQLGGAHQVLRSPGGCACPRWVGHRFAGAPQPGQQVLRRAPVPPCQPLSLMRLAAPRTATTGAPPCPAGSPLTAGCPLPRPRRRWRRIGGGASRLPCRSRLRAPRRLLCAAGYRLPWPQTGTRPPPAHKEPTCKKPPPESYASALPGPSPPWQPRPNLVDGHRYALPPPSQHQLAPTPRWPRHHAERTARDRTRTPPGTSGTAEAIAVEP